MTAVINRSIIPAVGNGTHKSQRGFVPGRQLIQNAVDLDYHARMFALQAYSHNSESSAFEFDMCRFAVLAFFDFAAAFPSVAHAWLFLVVQYADPPKWVANFIKNLYSFNMTFHMTSSGAEFLFYIWSGVLQGCPLSATLFLMCVNPFLLHFDLTLNRSELGVVRACADDIGAALADYKYLKLIFNVFSLAGQVANLNLKPKKCNIIPLNVVLDESLKLFFQNWLKDNIPDWSDFKVVSCAKYLGFVLGPQAKESQWSDAVIKWDRRSRDIGASHCGPTLACFLYNHTALPVLGYRAQLLPPPEMIHLKERHVLHRILHLPPNTLELNTFYEMEAMGGPPLSSLRCYCRSALFRASFSTIVGWESQLQSLEALAADVLPLGMLRSPVLAPPCWDTPALVLNLSEACHGSGKSNVYREATAQIHEDIELALRVSLLGGPPLHLQKIAYRRLVSHSIPNNFESLLRRRLAVIAGFDLSHQDHINFFETSRLLQRIGKFHFVCWMKTVCNGWCTSYRMHENVSLPCVFGCRGGKDTLEHYLVCDILLSLLLEQFVFAIGPSPLHRLNLINPTPQMFILITVMFNMYHTLKLGYRSTVDTAVSQMRFGPCCQVASRVARELHDQYAGIFRSFPQTDSQ